MELPAGKRSLYALISMALVAPCFWQPRLQAGDLSSHIYNAWLAQLIESGRVEGLQIVHQTTNILFDLMLSGLFRLFGAEWAQRIAVCATVLVFVWGALAFVNTVAGRKCWRLLPCLAMLAYGWVFHMGFFNFYLSMGLCFWAMSLAWGLQPRRTAAAAALFALAYTAHLLPVIWSAGLLVYVESSRRMNAPKRAMLTGGFVAALILVHVLMRSLFAIKWSPAQLALATGADQLRVFDWKYLGLAGGLLAIWGLLFLGLLRQRGAREVVGSIPFQLFIISAAAVPILPEAVLLPGFGHALGYIGERMSLGVAVCVCALLGAPPPRPIERRLLLVVAALFFVFVYRDERALNSFEDRMQDVVSTLAPGSRVVSAIGDPELRANVVAHTIDRVCVGRCYSYANYEASTRQFRIRTLGPNPIVVTAFRDSAGFEAGKYVVQPRDEPLYAVDLDRQGRLRLRPLPAGAPSGLTELRILAGAGPRS